MAIASTGGLAYITNAAGGGGVDVVIGGNTSGALATVSSGSLFLAGGNKITLSQNGQSVTISGAGGAAILMSAGASSANVASVTFANSNGVTFGLSTGPSLGTITASHALNVSDGGVASNALSGITFSNSNGVSFGLSTGVGVGTMTASIAAQSNQQMTLFATGNTTQSSTQTTNASSLIFAGSGGISMGVSGGTILASGLVAAGTGQTVGSAIPNGALVATLNTNGLSIGVPRITRVYLTEGGLTQISAPGNGSLSLKYVSINNQLTGTRLDALIAMSAGSAATNATAALVFSVYGVIYSKSGVGSTLNSYASGSTQTTYTYASNSAGNTQLTNSAIYPMSVPINMNMPPGEYVIGFNMITATSSVGLTTTNLGATISMMGANNIQTNLNYAEITANTATSTNYLGGMGIYTAATTGAPVSINLNAIAQTGASLAQANIALVIRNF